MVTNKIGDFDIQALIDGELDPLEEIRVRGLIEASQENIKRYHALLNQKYLLQRWWQDAKKTFIQ
jgi:hypothetical protein